MSIITFKVDDATAAALDGQAREHGRTLEEEAHSVLSNALVRRATPSVEPDNMAKRLQQRFAPFGGVDLPIPCRPIMRDPPFTFLPYDDDELS